MEEENGNVVLSSADSKMQESVSSIDNRSSSSLSTSTTSDFSELLTSPSPTPNANLNANLGAAAVVTSSSKTASSSSGQSVCGATAEIEPQEAGDGVVAVETAAIPQDVSAATIPGLFAPSALDNCRQKRRQNANACEFAARWLYVQEETFAGAAAAASEHALTDHERELLLEYKMKESKLSDEKVVAGASGGGKDADGYEKVLPKHGDAFFHKMKTVIEENPGQVLRCLRSTTTHYEN